MHDNERWGVSQNKDGRYDNDVWTYNTWCSHRSEEMDWSLRDSQIKCWDGSRQSIAMQVDELQRLQTPKPSFVSNEFVVAKSEKSKIGEKDDLCWNFALWGI